MSQKALIFIAENVGTNVKNRPMKEISEGEVKDMILRFALEHEGEPITSWRIQKELFPYLTEDQVILVLERMADTIDKVADISFSDVQGFIVSNGLTKAYLDQGGFTKREQIDQEERIKLEEREHLETELAKSNIRANRLNEKNNKFNRTFLIINAILAVINLGILIWQIVSPE